MNIGDRVRLMHGREEGIITRFLENNLVEVAIDNDFTIPVMRREVVVIAPEEDKAFGRSPQPELTTSKKISAPKAPELPQPGFFAALTNQSSELLAVNLVNNTDYDILFTYGEEKSNQYKGVVNDKLTSKSSKIVAHLHLKDFEKWPSLVIQYLQHRANTPTLLEPALKKLQFKAASFYKSQKEAPVLKKEAYLFQLDAKPVAIDAQKIQEKIQNNEPVNTAFKVTTPAHEVDLHIEKLTDQDISKMSNSEIIKKQLEVFLDNLERAIAANMHEIVFIHGVGTGVLRKEIHKYLSQNSNINYYEDARKEKFGFGATLVRLK